MGRESSEVGGLKPRLANTLQTEAGREEPAALFGEIEAEALWPEAADVASVRPVENDTVSHEDLAKLFFAL